MIEKMRRAMAPLEGRIRLMLGRAIVRLVDDAAMAQVLQLDLLADESQDGVERFQNYGFTSHPHLGAEALAAFLGGLRSHAVVIAVEDRRYRLKNLAPGEVAMFDDLGNVIKLGRERISILAVSGVDIVAPEGMTIEGDVAVDGDVTVTGDVTADGISLKTHTHGGVQAGGASTGAPE